MHVHLDERVTGHSRISHRLPSLCTLEESATGTQTPAVLFQAVVAVCTTMGASLPTCRRVQFEQNSARVAVGQRDNAAARAHRGDREFKAHSFRARFSFRGCAPVVNISPGRPLHLLRSLTRTGLLAQGIERGLVLQLSNKDRWSRTTNCHAGLAPASDPF